MNRNAIKRALTWGFAALALAGCIATVAIAQQTTSVERGEVLAVSGNDILVKMDTGEVKHFVAPAGATATVDGKTLTVAELRPGMKLQRTITTTTTHTTVKTVRTVKGKVWQVQAPFVTFTGEDGKNKRVKVPNDAVFMIEGQKRTVFELRPGMVFVATVVTEAPEMRVSTSKSTTGSGAPPVVIAQVPQTIEPSAPVVVEEPVPAASSSAAAASGASSASSASAAAEPAPTKLPKTGTPVPFIGLLGLTMSLAGLGMRLVRNR